MGHEKCVYTANWGEDAPAILQGLSDRIRKHMDQSLDSFYPEKIGNGMRSLAMHTLPPGWLIC